MAPAFMGESELFSDLKSDFERSCRSEILDAGFLAPPAQKLQRLAVAMVARESPKGFGVLVTYCRLTFV